MARRRGRSHSRRPASHQGPAAKPTPELVKQVADKVYALMLQDLRLANERQRFSDKIRPLTKRQRGW